MEVEAVCGHPSTHADEYSIPEVRQHAFPMYPFATPAAIVWTQLELVIPKADTFQTPHE